MDIYTNYSSFCCAPKFSEFYKNIDTFCAEEYCTSEELSDEENTYLLQEKILSLPDIHNSGVSKLKSKMDLLYSYNEQILLYELETNIINIVNCDYADFEDLYDDLENAIFDERYMDVFECFLGSDLLHKERIWTFFNTILNNVHRNQKAVEMCLSEIFDINPTAIWVLKQSLAQLHLHDVV